MSAPSIFVDTNILVYAHDADAGARHRTALDRVTSLWDLPYPPSISTQVLQELYVTLIKKGASAEDSKKIVSIYLDWDVVSISSDLVMAAIEIHDRFRLSFWDSLIVAAAQQAKADVLWSEDLQPRQRFDALVVENPLATNAQK